MKMKSTGRPWSPETDRYLLEKSRSMDRKALGFFFGRSQQEVQERIAELKKMGKK